MPTRAAGNEAQAESAATASKPGRSVGERVVLAGATREFRTRKGDSTLAVAPIDLEIEAGSFVALVGPSGCGKTTLLRMIGGLISTTSGEITYRDEPVNGPVHDLGVVFQQAVLLEWRTVIKNVALQLEARKIGTRAERHAKAKELLDAVGLAGLENRYPAELSGGQQQRVSLCRALIHEPGLLLMDEPFGALDAITREQLQQDLSEMWTEQRSTVIFVTHDVVEAVTLADRVIVMGGKPGAIVGDITVDVPRPRSADILSDPTLRDIAIEVRGLLEH